jgi:hypothetical protein
LESGQHISGKEGRIRIIESSTGEVIKDLGETPKKNILKGAGRKKDLE